MSAVEQTITRESLARDVLLKLLDADSQVEAAKIASGLDYAPQTIQAMSKLAVRTADVLLEELARTDAKARENAIDAERVLAAIRRKRVKRSGVERALEPTIEYP